MSRRGVLWLLAAVLVARAMAGDLPAALQPKLQGPEGDAPATPAQANEAPAPATATLAQATEQQPAAPEPQESASSQPPKCASGKCKPEVSSACKGRLDGCRNETECCEIDKCSIWQHVGRDSAVLLVFYATWCPVSQDFMLPYDLLRVEYEPFTNVLVAKVDADQNPNLVADFGVEEFPTIMFFRRDCYWSASGCLDPLMFRKYNGPSNEFEHVNEWVKQQLAEENNANAFKALPEGDDGLTGCKMAKAQDTAGSAEALVQLPPRRTCPLSDHAPPPESSSS